jgi:hypothetical protein
MMFVDPIFDGLRRAVQLPSDLGNGSMMVNNLFDGMALNGDIIARDFFRHWKRKGIWENVTKTLSTKKRNL